MTVFKILLVEDDESWQKILPGKICNAIQNIDNADCDIKVIDNFNEAYIALDENSWNLLVTDIGLGELEAQKLGKQLVQIAHKLSVPSIVVSGTKHLNRGEVRELLKKLGACDFFDKGDFDDEEFINKVQEVLQQEEQPQEQTLSPNYSYQLSGDDKQYLIMTLSSLAASATISATEYFKNLINQLSLPEKWRNSIADIWTGNTNADTSKLVNWIEQKKSYPNESEKPDYTVLGSLIEKLLEETADRRLLDIIITYQLITDEVVLNDLKSKYL